MALHLTDKTNQDRSEPRPNTHDIIIPESVKAHGTLSTSYSASNTAPSARLQFQNNQIVGFNSSNQQILTINNDEFIYSDGTNPRVLMGEHATLGEGFYVSETGQNATTATGNNLIFNSNQDIFKISTIVTGTLSVSFPAHSSGGSTYIAGQDTTSTLIMAHSLGFIPSLQCEIFNTTTSTYEPVVSGSACTFLASYGILLESYAFGLSILQIYADSTNVYVAAYRNYAVTASSQTLTAESGSATFKVYCQQETAN